MVQYIKTGIFVKAGGVVSLPGCAFASAALKCVADI